ncbi:hypothetical protein C0J50_11127 [Silurus asotus]|uniref:Uncharacterized protein n=1 Tax=Silurus asotus TaxID=30991 RepID=A0AAD5FFC3_SILAS|nr:hypothetical protein C0J50_11127 [Silurus asotus]
MEQYVPEFKDKDVDGEILLQMDGTKLKALVKHANLYKALIVYANYPPKLALIILYSQRHNASSNMRCHYTTIITDFQNHVMIQ